MLRLAAAYTRQRFNGKATRLCVRTLASPDWFPSGHSLPSTPSLPSEASLVLRNGPTPDLGSAPRSGCPSHVAPIVDRSMDPIGSPGSRRLPFIRDAAFHPGGAIPSRITTVHVRPSVTGTNSASAKFRTFEAVYTAPHMTPIYASNASLPKRPQDSVPACLLGFDRTGLAAVGFQ